VNRGTSSNGIRRRQKWAAALLASVWVGGLIVPATAQAQSTPAENTLSFDIASQSLVDALSDFGRQSGLQVSVDADQARGLSSPGVRGKMTATQALDRLLAATGLTGRIEGRIVSLRPSAAVASQTAPGVVVLDSLRVEGAGAAGAETGAQRDSRRKDAVYDQDVSSTYAAREEVERYKGVNTADVLKGMVNVFSGDARNGGALDPSIRGIQGPGRVPVIIDGTEQALTVWRGYNGASNRSYIDPSLISGVQVLKGPVSTRGVNGSTGGAVVINTLDAADILRPGKNFGIELRLEGGNNSTNPRLPTLLTGQDYRTIPNFVCPGVGPTPIYSYCDPSLRVTLRTPDDNEAFSAGDRAIRLAAAGRVGDFELFGAYAFRERGNYFSGKTAPGYYQQEDLPLATSTFVRRLALNYEPGNEIPNTSSKLESFLAKATWHIAHDQALQLGFRDSKSTFGDILPSRIYSSGGPNFGNVQWPLSKVDAKAYNAEYKWQPGNRWIDLRATAWATDTNSATYSSGGFPNSASFDDPILVNTAISHSDNDRYGFTASNQFNLSSTLNFLLEGNWQHERLRSGDAYSTAAANGWRQFPRAGRRKEYRINFSGEWRPARFLKLNAGVSYSGYWAKDDFLPEYIARQGGSISQSVTESWNTSYRTTGSGLEDFEIYTRNFLSGNGFSPEDIETLLPIFLGNYDPAIPFDITYNGPIWAPRSDGQFHRADNICLNGFVNSVPKYNGECIVIPNNVPVLITKAERKSAHRWSPTASATFYLSDASRVYFRFADAYRYPSMFESTIGFSASINPLHELKPERIRSLEAAWIQDLRPLLRLGDGQQADLKLTWFHNTTRDAIERSTGLMFSNIDKQVIAGLELQARFDNGRFFTDVGASHMTTNKVCDESVATQLDTVRGRVPDCVKYGFVTGFLLTQATPEDAVNWTVGGRFLNRKLEVGGRLTWYAGYHNSQLAEFTDGDHPVPGSVLNIPYTWGGILTFDAYAKFRIGDRFSAELTGLNLNNRYYLDPLSRSLLPAPGRTVRLSLTGRF
jgi:hemoglobin/transferrin/lactoferrin receptor protein